MEGHYEINANFNAVFNMLQFGDKVKKDKVVCALVEMFNKISPGMIIKFGKTSEVGKGSNETLL